MRPDQCGHGRPLPSLPPGDREEVEKFASFLAGDLAYDSVAKEYVPVDQAGRPGVLLARPPGPPTPNCPVCKKPPVMLYGGGTQAFCGDPACQVMTWNPNDTVEQFHATAGTVDLSPLAHLADPHSREEPSS